MLNVIQGAHKIMRTSGFAQLQPNSVILKLSYNIIVRLPCVHDILRVWKHIAL